MVSQLKKWGGLAEKLLKARHLSSDSGPAKRTRGEQVIQSSFVEAPWRQSGGGKRARAGVVVFSPLPL